MVLLYSKQKNLGCITLSFFSFFLSGYMTGLTGLGHTKNPVYIHHYIALNGFIDLSVSLLSYVLATSKVISEREIYRNFIIWKRFITYLWIALSILSEFNNLMKVYTNYDIVQDVFIDFIRMLIIWTRSTRMIIYTWTFSSILSEL